jgi:large subunit ribosomal protein L13
VIVVNCERVRFSGKAMKHDDIPYLTSKMERKEYDSYSGYPGGRRVRTGVEMWQQRPDMILREAVRRMLPKNKLGRHMLKKLRLVVGAQHPYQAQQPKPLPQHLLPSAKG